MTRTLPDPAVEPFMDGGIKRAAAILGISERAAYDAVRRGEIPSVRVANRIKIPTAKFLTKFELDAA